MEKKLTKNEKGITLVALIITIIILLILAVVSIRAITGDNILGKAEAGKNMYSEAEEEEKVKRGVNSALIDGTGTIKDAESLKKALEGEGLKVKSVILKGTNYEAILENGNKYTISINGGVSKADGGSSSEGISKASDFTHQGGKITGLSETGIAKLNNGITDLTIPTKIDDDSITEIGDMAFAGVMYNEETEEETPTDYSKITSVIIPGEIQKIGMGAFAYCTELKQVGLVEGLTSLGQIAFAACTSLKDIVIPSSVQTIGSTALGGAGIESATILEGVQKLGDLMFNSCKQLKVINLPSTITFIANDPDSFNSTNSLTTVNINQTAEDIKKIEGIDTINSYTNIYDKDGNKVEL